MKNTSLIFLCTCISDKLHVYVYIIDALVFVLQKPLGLLSLLDEESTFPNGTDMTFANKLKQHLNTNSYFRGERGKAFAVSHYAGEVCTWSLHLSIIIA